MQNTHWKITEPCHEPIEKMDVTTNGHYCHSCKKEVINLDGKTHEDIGYKPGDDFCGSVTMPAIITPAPLSRWSSFMLKWLGVSALFFVPFKKAKPQIRMVDDRSDAVEKNRVSKSKRIVGTVQDADNKPLRTKVTLQDADGNIIAETMSLANGRYLMQVDTPLIKTDTLMITAVDSPGIIQLDSHFVTNYHKDSIWLGPMITEPYTLAGVSPQIITGPPITFNWNRPANFYTVVVVPENAAQALQQEAMVAIQMFNSNLFGVSSPQLAAKP